MPNAAADAKITQLHASPGHSAPIAAGSFLPPTAAQDAEGADEQQAHAPRLRHHGRRAEAGLAQERVRPWLPEGRAGPSRAETPFRHAPVWAIPLPAGGRAAGRRGRGDGIAKTSAFRDGVVERGSVPPGRGRAASERRAGGEAAQFRLGRGVEREPLPRLPADGGLDLGGRAALWHKLDGPADSRPGGDRPRIHP